MQEKKKDKCDPVALLDMVTEVNTRRYHDFTHWAFVQKLLSSRGGMSDVESILTPLRDRPRMAGSYGVSLNDPKYSL